MPKLRREQPKREIMRKGMVRRQESLLLQERSDLAESIAASIWQCIPEEEEACASWAGQVLKDFLNLNLFEHCPKKMQMQADARY
jgi:tRNA-dihydrouridine synthase